jgi:hypothetical protein
MNNYLKKKAELHKVQHAFSGKNHFYSVQGFTNKYDVCLNITCNCQFSSVQGIPNGKLCSHQIAVLQEILKKGLQWNEEQTGKSKD